MRCLDVYYISRLYVELKAQCILERLPYRRIAGREKRVGFPFGRGESAKKCGKQGVSTQVGVAECGKCK